MTVALITGASRGFGNALARQLAVRGWTLVVNGRDSDVLARATAGLGTAVTTVPGDVADPAHRAELARAVGGLGRLDLLVNNASVLGPSPQPTLDRYPLAELRRVFDVNVLAPLALTQLMLPWLVDAGGSVVSLSSDAAVEAYPGWGGYGASKAALDQLTAVLAAECAECAERRDLRVYAFDPGDMRTDMHQLAFPGEDISDRPLPETVVPALLRLLDERPPSGRYRAADLLVPAAQEAVGTGAAR
ncbi:MAG TPA: SDR family oxidoreductase [Micromonosporaceae bacterium]|nr:SDR family oxidoreductase [Micromonosporaceae bacterium]